MDKQTTFQLERWTGREYVPHGAPHVTDNPHTASNVAETARMLGLPAWRLVRVDKDRPRKLGRPWKPTPGRASGRSIARVQSEYLDWAVARGLECITVYSDPRAADLMMRAHAAGMSSRSVDAAEFIGPAPAAELIGEGE